MRFRLDLTAAPDLPRMLFRSAHVYLLLGSCANLLLGLYAPEGAIRWGAGRRGKARVLGSLAILSAPILSFLAFVFEPGRASFARPFAGAGALLLLAGTLLHAVAARGARSAL